MPGKHACVCVMHVWNALSHASRPTSHPSSHLAGCCYPLFQSPHQHLSYLRGAGCTQAETYAFNPLSRSQCLRVWKCRLGKRAHIDPLLLHLSWLGVSPSKRRAESADSRCTALKRGSTIRELPSQRNQRTRGFSAKPSLMWRWLLG